MAGIEIGQINKKVSSDNEEKELFGKTFFSVLNKDIKLFGNKLSDQKKERFYSELTILFGAKVDLGTALELISDQQKKTKHYDLFKNIFEEVLKGASLSAAILKTAQFSEYEFHSIRIGEETGKLIEVLIQLSEFYSGRIKQRRQIISAISYPIIVLLTACGAVFFMLRFVVPMFSDVFKRFHSDLPVLTKIIIKLSGFLGVIALPVFIIIIILVIFIYSQRSKLWFRKIYSSTFIKIPLVGNIIRNVYLARFCQSMGLLLGAKVPLDYALELAQKMIGFYPIERSLESIRNEVMSGTPLSKSLSQHKIYDKRLVALVKVAEEVNQLDLIFYKLATQYTEDSQHKVGIINNILEPIIIIILGLLVAVILISMYLPLFKLSNSFGV